MYDRNVHIFSRHVYAHMQNLGVNGEIEMSGERGALHGRLENFSETSPPKASWFVQQIKRYSDQPYVINK